MEEDSTEFSDIANKTFLNKYHCISKIGNGTFGSVFKARYNKNYFALKFESKKKDHDLLEKEAEILDYLHGANIPYIESYFSTDEYNILVMELLGKSLGYYQKQLRNFSLKTVCMIGDQVLSLLEYIHDHHIVHRDIKPDNLCMGLNHSKFVYIVDFGLAKKYRSSATLMHYPLINKKRLTGTPRYASINALKGFEQSRRDDLESLGYVLMYLLRGELPWQHINAKSKEERNQKILQKKMEISSSKLCEGFPIEFEKFLDYTKNMEYTQTPDYDMLRNLLLNVMKNNNLIYNYIFDWTTKEEIKKRAEVEYSRKDCLIQKGYISNKSLFNANINRNNVNMNKFRNLNAYNNQHTNTNIYNSNDYLPIIKDKDLNNNDEVNANCSSACNIF